MHPKTYCRHEDANTCTRRHTHKHVYTQREPYLSGVHCCCRGVSSRLWVAAGGSGRRTEPVGWQYQPRGVGGAEGPLGVEWAGWGWRGRERGAAPGAAAAEPDTEIIITLMLHNSLDGGRQIRDRQQGRVSDKIRLSWYESVLEKVSGHLNMWLVMKKNPLTYC